MAAQNAGNFKYNAFISYRHRPLDMAVARAIHKQLETYRVPAFIRKRTDKKRIKKVFRDQDELPLMADLGEGIRIALRESEWLIVVCSPDLPLSKWCLAEIDYFIELGRQDHILTVLVAGEPEESFPQQLLFINGDAREPLAADVRSETTAKMLKKVKREKLRLLAPMLGVGYDDLRRRHRERAIRRTITLGSIAMAVMMLATAYVFNQNRVLAAQIVLTEEQRQIALDNEARANLERDNALISQSKFLASMSSEQLSLGDPTRAALLALAALPQNLDYPERPLVLEAQTALRIANLSTRQAGYSLVSAVQAAHTRRVEYLEAFDLLLLMHSDATEIYNGKSGALVEIIEHTAFAYSESGARFATVVRDGDYATLRVYDLPSLESRDFAIGAFGYESLEFFPDGKRICVSRTVTIDGSISVYDTDSGELLWHKAENELCPDVPQDDAPDNVWLTGTTISPDGCYIAYCAEGLVDYNAAFPRVCIINVHTQQIAMQLDTQKMYNNPTFTPDGTQLLLQRHRDDAIEVWDGNTAQHLATFGEDYDHPTGFARTFEVSPNGQYLVVHTYDDKALIYDLRMLELVDELSNAIVCAQIAFTDEATLVLRDARRSALLLYDIDSGKLAEIPTPGGLYDAPFVMGEYTIHTDAFRATSRTIVTYSANGIYQIWQRSTRSGYLPLDDEDYTVKAFSNGGMRALLANEEHCVIYDALSGVRLVELDTSACVEARWSPDDTQLLTSRLDGTVELWDVATGALISSVPSKLTTPLFPVRLFPSPDWKHLILNSPAHTEGLYALPSLELISTLEHLLPANQYGVTALDLTYTAAFMPNGESFWLPLGVKIAQIDVATLKLTASYDFVASDELALSSDGTRLAFFCNDNKAKLCIIDTASGAVVLREDAFDWKYNRSIVWSADGSRLATCEGWQTQTRVWDVETGNLLQTLDIDCPSFSPDGTLISGEVAGAAQSQFAGTGSGEIYDIGAGGLYMVLPRAGIFSKTSNEVLMTCGIWRSQSLLDEVRAAKVRLDRRSLTHDELRMFYLS